MDGILKWLKSHLVFLFFPSFSSKLVQNCANEYDPRKINLNKHPSIYCKNEVNKQDKIVCVLWNSRNR